MYWFLFAVLFYVANVHSVFIFTHIQNHCLEMSHDHLFAKPCNPLPAQNFQFDDELYRLSLVDVDTCLTFDTIQLPLRFEDIGKKSKPAQEFNLVSPLSTRSRKGVLIKTKGLNLCASIVNLNYPLYFQSCDPFNDLQIFSFSGAFNVASNGTLVVRPPIVRLSTT